MAERGFRDPRNERAYQSYWKRAQKRGISRPLGRSAWYKSHNVLGGRAYGKGLVGGARKKATVLGRSAKGSVIADLQRQAAPVKGAIRLTRPLRGKPFGRIRSQGPGRAYGGTGGKPSGKLSRRRKPAAARTRRSRRR
jgi:hypothetical protein